MIEGEVNFNREPMIRLTLIGNEGQQTVIEALVDTGFNGSLTLPQTMITQLNWSSASNAMATLADGSTQQLSTFRGWFSGKDGSAL